MKRFIFLALFCARVFASGQAPNFYFTNNSDRDAYFIVCGANDLLTIKNLELISPKILTLHPGQTYAEHISLRGHLEDKKPLLYLYPRPQGEQKAFQFSVDIDRDNIHQLMVCPYADERVYGLGWHKKIYVELVEGYEEERLGPGKTSYYKGLTLHSLANDRGEIILENGGIIKDVVRDSEIGRSWNYEKFGRWADSNIDEFSAFIARVDSFVYTYLHAGGIIPYIWRYGLKGAKDIARVRRAKARMEKLADVKL